MATETEHKMYIHKHQLTELNVHHHILTFTNYMVSMINKSPLPLKFNVHFVSE